MQPVDVLIVTAVAEEHAAVLAVEASAAPVAPLARIDLFESTRSLKRTGGS